MNVTFRREQDSGRALYFGFPIQSDYPLMHRVWPYGLALFGL